jgi:hypothetical protein
MYKVDVDFDVYKELTVRRATEEVTYNDVIRELVDLGPMKAKSPERKHYSKSSLVVKGVEFPNGTEFRSQHKGKYYNAIVENGYLILNGEKYSSPSPAAVSITNNSVNGWIFWECRLPGRSDWTTLKSLRN